MATEHSAHASKESLGITSAPLSEKPAPAREVKVIRRKLNGYVGFANLPKQWHRKSIRRGFNLNVMVVGESGLGKSTLMNTLFNRNLYSASSAAIPATEKPSAVEIESLSADIEENGVRLHLTIIDTPGFGDAINNTDSWTSIVSDINNRFDTYLEAESKVTRNTIADTRVHALIYFIEPTGHSLKPLDITFMKQVHGKVNLVPVIAKSDTMTEEEIVEFKQRINDDIITHNINIFKPAQFENDDDDTILSTQDLIAKIPFAVVGSTTAVTTADDRQVRGRSYPWGVIEVDNEEHCDFVRLRDLLVRNFLEELRERTGNVLYENYRTEKLKKMGIDQDNSVFREFDPNLKQEEEKVLHEAKLAKMEAEMKTVFQQKVSEKEKKLQMSESELFARHKEMKDKLLKQVKVLEEKKSQLEKSKTTTGDGSLQPAQKTRKGFLR
ncbi:hypothetical protein BABINDRAFT_8197 [Babjeviella inositovora NRRL Y-12698]|uniref:Septin-type G domain-containing protein n=1 Tax=Babjeviella inositovora NRRL Y-12698 TaxID=984486 RepID=A0A1E3QSX3_9ASCO|nr:uncharacterized protein BABINDRAFT_8197 [Babjeviella inositovora NRRL Y-12698]ODQ80017.1 hypothetical protein BABINDRAFT_8197 [Babjeviella inositovora NRRL Y-12698]